MTSCLVSGDIYTTKMLFSSLRKILLRCAVDHKNATDTYPDHYNDVIMGGMASQITSLTIVYSTVYSGADQGKHQSSASLAFVRGIHRWPVNSPHKWPVTRKMFPFDDVIMSQMLRLYYWCRLILHTNNPVYLPFAHKMKYMLLCLIL